MKTIFALLVCFSANTALAGPGILTRFEQREVQGAAEAIVTGSGSYMPMDLIVQVLLVDKPYVDTRVSWRDDYSMPQQCLFTYNLMAHDIKPGSLNCRTGVPF